MPESGVRFFREEVTEGQSDLRVWRLWSRRRRRPWGGCRCWRRVGIGGRRCRSGWRGGRFQGVCFGRLASSASIQERGREDGQGAEEACRASRGAAHRESNGRAGARDLTSFSQAGVGGSVGDIALDPSRSRGATLLDAQFVRAVW